MSDNRDRVEQEMESTITLAIERIDLDMETNSLVVHVNTPLLDAFVRGIKSQNGEISKLRNRVKLFHEDVARLSRQNDRVRQVLTRIANSRRSYNNFDGSAKPEDIIDNMQIHIDELIDLAEKTLETFGDPLA